MPIYEYRCERCSHRLEAFQKISDAPLADCPECNQASLRKLISPSSFRLKGTGWYVTDFRDRGKRPDSGDARPAGTTGEAKSGEAQSGEAKSGEAKSGEAKSGEAKSGEAQSRKAQSGKAGGRDAGGAKSEPARSGSASDGG